MHVAVIARLRRAEQVRLELHIATDKHRLPAGVAQDVLGPTISQEMSDRAAKSLAVSFLDEGIWVCWCDT